MRLRHAAVAALAATAAVSAAAPAHAQRARSGIYGERYCEILIAKGALPDVTVTVWNTIGFSTCPPAWWSGLDANAIKTQEGAVAVLLNGPRFWVIDRASTPSKKPVRSFSGQRLRAVATLRFREASQFAQVPYTTRAVARDNTWTWRKGRRVFELVAPGGVVYRMQAFSQIVDRGLRLRDLPRLGSRLKLPGGWRYRTRVLRRAYDLPAGGRATILQDELQNTYQRLP